MMKDASLSGDKESIIRNGKLGSVVGMTIYESNNLYSTTDGSSTVYYCIAGHPIAISFAAQLQKTRAMEAQDTFGQYISGLEVYGYDVTKPQALSYLYATR
jgi:hypothetical protein